ncbi:MAG: hypothetical protein WC901_01005 [Candidatus Margulisiibacteriota bacterium]
MMSERRSEDRSIGERVAVVETQALNIGIMLNQIKQDIHMISEMLKQSDSSLEKRVNELERSRDKLTGAWFALTVIASIIGFLMHYNP